MSNTRLRADLRAIVDAALRACDARTLLSRALDTHPLPVTDTLNVIVAGKAAQPMLDAFMARHRDRTREVVLARGGHPLPDAESCAAGEAALRLADANRARGDTLVVLLSGGASAMIEAPAEGVTLEQLIDVTRELLQSGRPIAEMNARRKELSAIKGGKLALRAGRSITYAISDVHAPVEDDPAVIGSGPTFLREAVSGVDAEFFLAGSRRDAMAGASVEAERRGYGVRLIAPPTLGEAREAAKSFVALTSEDLAEGGRIRLSVISAGETTVRLPSHHTGRGGRNQEFALAAALEMGRAPEIGSLERLRDTRGGDWALASVGTDGIDGPTDAAGAIVDSTTLSRAAAAGLDPRAALDAHDSYPFFQRLSDLVVTGPTGTNVGDLQVFLRRVNHDAEGQ